MTLAQPSLFHDKDTFQQATGLINKAAAVKLVRSCETFLQLWFHSIWLPRSLKRKQGQSYGRQSGIWAILGATHRYCVSVRELADKPRCLFLEPWRPAVECHSAKPVEFRGGSRCWLFPTDLWENGYDKQRQNNPVSLMLTSRPNFYFIFMSRIVLKEQKQQRQRELISMCASVVRLFYSLKFPYLT